MAEISGEILKSAIVRKLKEAYPDTTIYKDTVKQGMKLPCFFVRLIHAMDSPKLGTRSLRDYLIHVRYHTKGSKQAELNNIGDHLAELLRMVELDDGLIRGRSQGWDVRDGVLTYRIRFRLYTTMEEIREDPMEELEYRGEINDSKE